MLLHRRNIRRALLGATALAGAASVGWASPALAQARQVQFDIAPQPLSSALRAYGESAEQQLIYSEADVRRFTAPALQGAYTPDEALTMLLAGTGLTTERTPSGILRIASAQDPQSGSAAGDGADGTVEALIVTAQKREEDIQDVPIAISAFTQEDLTRSQVAGGPDLMTQVPNMTFTKTNFTSYSIQLRGIGTQAISATTDPAVAVAFNNTPFITNRFFEQEFYDLERVEVLRGPQGTLYGRNATAGVVNIISAKPKFRYEAKVAGDIANYNGYRLEGMVNIPLVEDMAALRIAGAWTKREGFVKNILTGEQTDGRDLWSGRVSLAIEPTDRFRADLIYERFEEDDDRLRSGKQLCKKDLGPNDIADGVVGAYPLIFGVNYLVQGCRPSSLYAPESFQTPHGYALPYYGPAGALGSPVDYNLDPYASELQSRNLREIETHIVPEYEAKADLVELQLRFDLSSDITLSSETGFARDSIFSFQDFNRFDTNPGVFLPSGSPGYSLDIVDESGVFCDPQVGCTNRLAAADLATAQSQQFSQEFRVSSDLDGAFNFNLGANFLRYDTEVKYYVFINSLTAFKAGYSGYSQPWTPGVSDNVERCFGGPGEINSGGFVTYMGRSISDPNQAYSVTGCSYIDPNDIHNLNDQGRNYFLSKNPYNLLSYAAFGEAYYNLLDNLKFTAGFRWTVDKKTAPQHPSWLLAQQTYGTAARKIVQQEWREPTGRLAIDWKPELGFTDETLVYASYVRGYKAGGANPPPPVIVLYSAPPTVRDAILADSQTHPETFEAEFVHAYEVGSKNTLLDGRLTLNLGAFYYDYEGYQISQIVNRSAVNLNFDAKVWGLEMEADWRPVENLRLGLKVGYENTRLADGSQAIDLMDRTAGREGWMVVKPFPPMPSNCVFPTWFVEMMSGTYNADLCSTYFTGLDPITFMPYVADPTRYTDSQGRVRNITASTVIGGLRLIDYPGYDPASAPNNGEGFFKDLSGNELPNAPNYTATLTADYTLPLPSDWLMTLHTDLYYQSEAWTRVFNTEGYDKLKAYTNVNLAAIFTNEDAGWNIMAYVKNVFDRDSITGAFLNSDDTGLTTNVFLTEPRLYGIRVTKMWDEAGLLGGLWGSGNPGAHDPFEVELSGYHGVFGQEHTLVAPPITELYSPGFAFPFGVQEDLDWGSAGGAQFTYQPEAGGWKISVAARYGRATGADWALEQEAITGGFVINGTQYYDPSSHGLFNYAETRTFNEESHTIVDFMVGQDIGLGALGAGGLSSISAGLRYARLKSTQDTEIHGRPDFEFPEDDIAKYGATMHRLRANVDAGREFEGMGPTVIWDGVVGLGAPEGWGVDIGLGGSVLWGKQKTRLEGLIEGDHKGGILSITSPPFNGPPVHDITPRYETPVDVSRTKSVAVPTVEMRLGLSYELNAVKLSGGYRFERFFDAIDGGQDERETYDRDFHGPYFKLSVGFGG